MDPSDETAFLEFAETNFGNAVRSSDSQWCFSFEKDKIQLLRCSLSDGVIVAGRISIFTNDKSDSAKQAESAFRKLKKWLQANYAGPVTCRNVNIPNSVSPARNVVVGPSAAQKLSEGAVQLKQSKKGLVVYELPDTAKTSEASG